MWPDLYSMEYIILSLTLAVGHKACIVQTKSDKCYNVCSVTYDV